MDNQDHSPLHNAMSVFHHEGIPLSGWRGIPVSIWILAMQKNE